MNDPIPGARVDVDPDLPSGSGTLARAVSDLSLCTAVPLALGYVTFYLFRTNYTFGAFTPDTYLDWYSHGVYRYRIIGRVILFTIYGVLRLVFPDGVPHHLEYNALAQLDRVADQHFYLSLVVLNVVFLGLFNLAAVRLLRSCSFALRPDQAFVTVAALDALVCLSLCVITVYDTPFYLALIVAFGLSLREQRSARIGLCLVVASGVLIRESMSLALAADAAILLARGGWRPRALFAVIPPTLAYVAAYGGIRLALGLEPDALFMHVPFDAFNFSIGALFLTGLVSVLLVARSESRRLSLVFLAFTLPYLVGLYLGALLQEVRLYVPIVMVVWLMVQLSPEAVRTRRPA